MIHFIAIGGSGMSAVAELLIAAGHEVQGSDQRDSAAVQHLRSIGAKVFIGHNQSHVEGATLVVVSSAIRETNVELAYAKAHGIPVIHRSEGLILAAGQSPFIAVAGSHGKTTTSGMLAIALRQANVDPSFAVGAVVVGAGTRAHLGTGPFIAEADESDGSFLNYEPRIALVTNIEPDHLFHYGSAEAVDEAFVAFARRITAGGLLVACADDVGSARLARIARDEGIRVCTYGVNPNSDVRIDVQHVDGDSASGILHRQGSYKLNMSVPGHHNLLNAAGAWCAGVELGISPENMAAALSEFQGTVRRFETIGKPKGVRVVDDYAHHPTEVAALLDMANKAVSGGKVIMVFQPHLYSRTRDFATEFGEALSAADEVVLMPVDGAREDPIPGVTSELIEPHLRTSFRLVLADPQDGDQPAGTHGAVKAVNQLAASGDIVLTSGCGTVTAVAPHIVTALEHRER